MALRYIDSHYYIRQEIKNSKNEKKIDKKNWALQGKN